MPGEIFDNRGRGNAGWNWPPVHRESHKFAGAAGLAALVCASFGWQWLAWPFAAVTIAILAFFRDPPRVTPQGEALIIAPADGLITLISKCLPPAELVAADGPAGARLGPAPLTRVSIFMSVFDVHINRAPIAGTIARMVYIPGRFVSADLDKASEDNERQHVLITGANGVMVGLTQIAGLIARRIVPCVQPGQAVAAGQRIGLIRFGSRVDVYLPEGTEPLVLLGQRVVAGETVLAEIGHAPHIEGVRQ